MSIKEIERELFTGRVLGEMTLHEMVVEYGENCAEIDNLDTNFKIRNGIHKGEFYRDQHKKSYIYCSDRNVFILSEVGKREREYKAIAIKEAIGPIMKRLDFSQEWFDVNEGEIWQMENALNSAKCSDTHGAYSGTNLIQVNELKCLLRDYKELRFLKSKLLILFPQKG